MPFPGCGKNVDTIEARRDSHSSQSSGVSAISTLMGEKFTITSPTIHEDAMEDVEVIVYQQTESDRRSLTCAKCSEDIAQVFSQAPLRPLVFLPCKHAVHYGCIDNPQKLCPFCQSSEGTEASRKRSNESASEKDSNKKAKQTRKRIDRNDSPTLKKLIMELTSPEPLEDGHSQDPSITLQSSVSEMDVNSLDFLDLYNKIGTAEDNLRRTTHDLIRSYYNFGQALFDHFRKTCNEDVSNAKVNDRIMNQIPM